MEEKKVYACFTTDVIHEGHLNIIKEAKKYGKVIIGALSDEASIRYNKFPTISLEERKKLYRSIPDVSQVIVQNKMHYDDVISLLKPDYVIHGDNWKVGPESVLREHLIKLLDKYGGKLIEVEYTKNENVKKIDAILKEKLAMPEYASSDKAPMITFPYFFASLIIFKWPS
jgi:cytidyltransferase-like protein